eukprot:TRINITY_DN777837_c0_g1_i1.p1 TRINITY_DN777837_c0_g1~~TRINITY_DN777837_c0_g1_i1.p1  ORF type:complete len:143 (-),score=41.64 TRINITY_DN777837_c0_g1_i1:371-799(-)
MKIFIVLLAIVACALASWSNCDAKVQVDNVTTNPEKIHKGDKVTMGMTFTVTDDIEFGRKGDTIKFQIKYFGMRLMQRTYDLCHETPHVGLPACPIPSGTYTFTDSFDIPSEAPKGSYEADAFIISSSGEKLMCVKDKMNVH